MSNSGSSKKRVDQHVQLTRPNTVLLSATVTGGKAERGVFTGAIANQIIDAKEGKYIYNIFIGACEQMKSSGSQIPEFRSTLRKPLVLPAASECKAGNSTRHQPQFIEDFI